jgi:thiamine kinase-like enzyme
LRLRSLDFWQGPIEVVPLLGGITNHNYLVRANSGAYVVRFCVDRRILGIDRRNELVCQRLAHGRGIAPEVVHQEDGILISAYVPGKTMTPEQVRDFDFIPRLSALFRHLHDGWDRLTGEILYFSVFQAVRTYARTACVLRASMPADIDQLLGDERRFAREIRPFVPVLCHNDLLAANIIASEESVWLVDWEYAGMGHPLFDLAGVSANCAFPEDLELALLEAYRGSVEPHDLRELRILKAMSILREALWSVIQTVAAEIDFDYVGYAARNFEAYRAARVSLR